MEQCIDATPSVHLLRAMGNQNLGWWKAIAELIDNSFDAAATRVVITSKGRKLTVEDDGRGMPDVTCAVRLGDHKPSESTTLGMYGIGLKDAWLWAGGSIQVTTVRDKVQSTVFADVQEMLTANSWSVASPVVVPTENESGTLVVLGLGRNRNLPKSSIKTDLEWAFAPGLEQGKQIVWKTGKKAEPLSAKKLPHLNDCVRDTFDVSGKKVSIEIGIVEDGEHMHNGPFWIQYRHRNIMRSSIGLMNGYTAERIGGVIRLGEGWSLTKNKDDFDANKEELADAIFSRIKFVLVKCDQLSQDIESQALTAELESRINEAIGDLRREKRDTKRNQTGTVAPGSSGTKRTRATKSTQGSGSVIGDGKGHKRRGLTLGFYYLDGDTIGDFDSSSNRITLNASHPYIKVLRDTKNKDALHAVAMAVFSEWVGRNEGSQMLAFEMRDFSQTFGAIMKPIAEELRDAKSA